MSMLICCIEGIASSDIFNVELESCLSCPYGNEWSLNFLVGAVMYEDGNSVHGIKIAAMVAIAGQLSLTVGHVIT